MRKFPSTTANKVYRAFVRVLWREKPRISHRGFTGSLRIPNFPCEYTWAFRDNEEIGPKMLAKIAKRTGLKPEDL